MVQTSFLDPGLETASRERLRAHQLARFRSLLAKILPGNPFYREKLGAAGLRGAGDLTNLEQLSAFPFTLKSELAKDQATSPPFGTNLTYPIERYVKIHQTSGTSGGRPLRVLDTQESWSWWLRCWRFVYAGAGVGPGDRVFVAFSFGPFIGFWAAYEAIPPTGAMALPGGGQDSVQRLRAIQEMGATALVCTPTYALRMAEVAREHDVDTAAGSVRLTIHAGEPGASIAATCRRIEEAWGAECHDHTGASEVGATGFTCRQRSGVHLIESEFLFEVVDPATGQHVTPGRRGELVITNLGRAGMPVIRYRTGDLVELDEGRCGCGRTWARLAGGILGRADEMVVVRGVNVFPSSIEDIVREYAAVVEFRIELIEERQMNELRLAIEPAVGTSDDESQRLARTISDEIHRRLLLRVRCEPVGPGTLPRFELKARRFLRPQPR
ncbi:MAG TPA: AMP-binding protein [Chloroflexota bacterium]|nr:AMP-binding protein [Chloroflexota bacterium]